MRTAVAFLDRIGSVGALLAALAAPCCFPLFAALGTAAGMSALGAYEAEILYLFQGFALLTLIGLAISSRRNHNAGPLILGVVSCAALAYHFYGSLSPGALYAGLLGLIGATLWNYLNGKKTRPPILRSTITCPHCGHAAEETMPTNACLFFYDCPACHARLKPQPGDCCVFCSYGSVRCPPIQAGAPCCA